MNQPNQVEIAMNIYPQALSITNERKTTLINEISEAILNTPRSELMEWGLRIPTTMSMTTIRRGKNFGRLIKTLGNSLIGEGIEITEAIRTKRIKEHISQHGKTASNSAIHAGKSAKNLFQRLSLEIKSDPSKHIPKLVAGTLGFLGASGGFDGDGGVPDLDFLGGIGAHRSIFTHSIIAGIVIETVLISFSDLTKTVYKNLPEQHDQLWDRLINGNEELLIALSQGISAGIAYHLGVDATIDGDGLYRDLPAPIPQEAHQIIISTNAAAEGANCIQSTDKSRKNAQHLFPTFKEATAFAKQHPGSKISRAKSEPGFIVERSNL